MKREIITQQQIERSRQKALALDDKIGKVTARGPARATPRSVVSGSQPQQKPGVGGPATFDPASEAYLQALLNEDLRGVSTEKIKELRVGYLQKSQQSANAEAAVKKDDYVSKLVKYIPTEVIAFYLTLTGIVGADQSEQKIYYTYALFLLGIIATIVYLRIGWKISNNFQVTISCIAFIAWAISLDQMLHFPKTFQALLLPTVTFMLPFFDPPAGK